MHGRETIVDAPCGSRVWNKGRTKLQGSFKNFVELASMVD
jgi:hypothetical protein